MERINGLSFFLIVVQSFLLFEQKIIFDIILGAMISGQGFTIMGQGAMIMGQDSLNRVKCHNYGTGCHDF